MPIYDRSDPGFDPSAVPAVFYASGREANAPDILGVNPIETGGVPPVAPAIGERRTMTVSFRMPVRRTRYYTMDVRLELRGMNFGDVLKLPVRFFHSAGGETR